MIFSRYLWFGLVLILILGSACSHAEENSSPPPPEKDMPSIYDFTVQRITGEDVKLATYKGNVMLIVNVASKCGFTPQYKGLQKLHETYADQGLVVMGFPANDFGNQEPGSNEQILSFCTTTYHVEFPMFAKISVTGKDKHPLYRFLTEKETNPEFAGEISWNFNKFLIDRTGKIVARFDSRDKPEDDTVIQAIETALKQTPSH